MMDDTGVLPVLSDSEEYGAGIYGDKPKYCAGCPKEKENCVTKGTWNPLARLTFIGESPSPLSIGANTPFKGPNGIVLRKLVNGIKRSFKDKLPEGELHHSVAYCAGAEGKPPQEVVTKCSELWKRQWATHYSQQTGPHVIVAFGLPAAKSAGIMARKILDVRGRVQHRMIGTRQVIIVPTLSLATLYAKPGLATVVQQDIMRAVTLAYCDEYVPPQDISELGKNYRIPKTLDEVRELCDEIVNYYDPAKQPGPWTWPITVDTETNTVKPFRKDAKVIVISFAWDDGRAAAILLDHPENTWYDPAAAWTEVKRVLECPKPKALHNFKFDAQFLERVHGVTINNVVWDTMCGQHWISEDQKGVYGLKALAPTYAPQFEGYEEKLHDALRQGEETVPTEEDAIKEAQELTDASGVENDTSWFESFEPDEALNAELEEKRAALQLNTPMPEGYVEPEWPIETDLDMLAKYREFGTAYFALLENPGATKKDKAAVMREWKKLAKEMSVPAPKGKTKKKKVVESEDQGFANVGLDIVLPYAAADADLTRMILKQHFRRLNVEGTFDDAKRVMENLYLPASRTLGALEFKGVKVDLNLAREYETALAHILNDTQTRLYNLACREFKIHAGRQLAEVLLNLGFNRIKETKNKEMSTSKDVLVAYQTQLVKRMRDLAPASEELKADQRRLDFIESLLLFKAAFKMKSSFLKRIREYSALDGHIHTTFHLTGTSTGRLSSARLNLQNLPAYMCRITRPNLDDPEKPIVINEGFNVKALLIPEDETEVFWNLDIKAAEIRVACYYSGDEALIKAVRDDLDTHTFFLTKIKHPELVGEALTEKYRHYYKLYKAGDTEVNQFRTAVKRVVFGTLYGAGPAKIAAQIGGGYTKEQAKDVIDSLFTAFPGLRAYITETKEKVRRFGEVSTVFGRYRRFMLGSVSGELKGKSEREAVNSLIQSTSSDLVISQLCEIDQHVHEIDGTIRLTVHDSIAGTIKRSRVKEMKAFFDYWLMKRIEERFPWLPVPFAYDLEIGENYGEKTKYSAWMAANAA